MVLLKCGVKVNVESLVILSRKKLFVPHILCNLVPRKSFLLIVGYSLTISSISPALRQYFFRCTQFYKNNA